MNSWIEKLFSNKDLLKMGHFQRLEDHNLGLGWLYYSLARMIRPRHVVIIGSWRGFAPLVFGKALQDNLEKGEVIFIDPSLVDDFWKDAASVSSFFKNYGGDNIRHYSMTSQQFVESSAYKGLTDIGILFIDGYHSKEQVKFDYDSFQHLLTDNGMILLHDSTINGMSGLYGKDKAYEYQVSSFVDELKKNKELEVMDFPFDSGVALVRKV